jgi:hypothetical protein
MTKLLKYIKSLKTIYVPSLWVGILVFSLFSPQTSLSFMFGTLWGVGWMTAYDWFHDK